jgi:hypothetical protein
LLCALRLSDRVDGVRGPERSLWPQEVADRFRVSVCGLVDIHGIASNLSPTYIAEVSPAPSRGRLVSLNQLAIVVGILAVQIANWSIAEADGNPADDARQATKTMNWCAQWSGINVIFNYAGMWLEVGLGYGDPRAFYREL